MSLWKRLRQYRRRAQFEAGLEEEMRFHRQMAGPAAFGSTALALEDSRAVWGFAWLESLLRDFRYALRGFGKSPGFVLAVVGTIGAALGLNTTLFTVFNAYVLRPFSVLDPWALYHFSWYGKNGQPHRFTWEQYQELAARQTLFTDVLATETLPADVEGRTLYGHLVSGNYFTMLAAGMAAGRPLLPRDAAAPGTGAVMVLSYDVWKNQFGADPNMVGRTVHLRGHAFEVVGIAGPAFAGVDSFPNGYWIPLSMHAVVQDLRELAAVPQSESLDLIGRLHPGLRPEVAKTALLAWSGGFAGSLAREQRPVGFEIDSTATMVPLTHDTILSFLPLFIAFGLVLLIACANVSNMMLARGLSRQREIGIRISLGAGRTRLVRQLLAESALLAVPAAALGMAVSVASIEAARRLLFATIPPDFAFVLMMPSLTPDLPVFGFILLAAMLAILVFGLAPALETTRSRLVEANRGDFSSDYRPARLRSFLLVTQVAVCSLLLIATAIVLRSQHRVTALNIGLDLHGVWCMSETSRRVVVVGGGVIGTACASLPVTGRLERDGGGPRRLRHGLLARQLRFRLPQPRPAAGRARCGPVRRSRRCSSRNSPFTIKPRLDPALWGWLLSLRPPLQPPRHDGGRPGHSRRAAELVAVPLYDDLMRTEPFDCEWETRGMLVRLPAPAGDGALRRDRPAPARSRSTWRPSATTATRWLGTGAGAQARPGRRLAYQSDAHLRPDKLHGSLAAHPRAARGVDDSRTLRDRLVSSARTAGPGRSARPQGEMAADAFVVAHRRTGRRS